MDWSLPIRDTREIICLHYGKIRGKDSGLKSGKNVLTKDPNMAVPWSRDFSLQSREKAAFAP